MNAKPQSGRPSQAPRSPWDSGEHSIVRRHLAPGLAAVLVVAATLAGFTIARRLESAQDLSKFEQDAAARIASIQLQLEDVDAPLEALASFWNASVLVRPDEFAEFVGPFIARRQYLEAMEWAPKVRWDQRTAFERRGRAEVDPGFEIAEIDETDGLRRARFRSHYFPVYYVRPYHGNEDIVGLDLASEPERAHALDRARDSGQIRSTGPLRLVQDALGPADGETGLGFIAVIPVYDKDGPRATAEERRRALIGFGVAVLRYAPIIERAMDPFELGGVDVAVYDISPGEDETLVHVHRAREGVETASTAADAFENAPVRKTFVVLGNVWQIRARPTDGRIATSPGPLSWVVLLVGLLGAGTLAVHLRSRDRRARELAHANRALEREIEERRRAEAEREAMQRQILETQKLESLGVLAGGIAHDFNNLLTGIMGNAGLALQYIVPSSPGRRPLEQVVSASERAALLTRQLLAYAGKGKVDVRPIDLSSHVRDLLPLMQASISKKVVLDVALGADLPSIEADPAQVQQLVMNLVINAAEACEDAPGNVRVRTLEESAGEGDPIDPVLGPPGSGRWIVLEVTDDGRGMDSATLSRIFDPFFTTKFAGRGLGLAAALGIVRAHGGSLRVASEPARGSRFRAFFPASGRPIESLQGPSDRAGPSGGRLVLVVDDEPLVRDLVCTTVEGAGFRVISATDGRAAVDIFRDNADAVALVLMDAAMPLMSGHEAISAIREIRPDVPVILTSGYGEVAVRLDRSITFLQKPYLPTQLVHKIREVLGSSVGPAAR